MTGLHNIEHWTYVLTLSEIYQSNTPTFTSRVRPWTLEQGQRRATPSSFVEIEVDMLEEGLVGGQN